MAVWLAILLAGYLACCGDLLASWLIGWWLARCLPGWETDWRGWQADYLAGYLAGWLAAQVAGWRFGYLGGYLAGWLVI